jgi:transcriptional regulator with XRE-family HTH domain
LATYGRWSADAHVGPVERGERNISLLDVERLANALGIGPWELLRPRRA